jgi:hypothetical protein
VIRVGLEAVIVVANELLQARIRAEWKRYYYDSFCAGMPTLTQVSLAAGKR